jgi:excisionase family DNA binding protein
MNVAMNETAVMTTPGYFGVPEAARWASVSEDTIWRLLDAKKLQRYRLGRRVLVSVAELEQLLQASVAG